MQPTNNPQTRQVPTPISITLTSTEVANHNTPSDCWMIISGNVYNFTAYVSQHPGGYAMAPYCGKDGTIAFQNKGGQGTHSNYANSLMTSYLLGPLNSTTQLETGNSSANTQTTPILFPTNNRESEDEDD
jgi:cytochrome b involved in lipid metabolism